MGSTLALGCGFTLGFAFGVGVVAFGCGFAFGVGVAIGASVGVGVGVGVTTGSSIGVGVGVAIGIGIGIGVGFTTLGCSISVGLISSSLLHCNTEKISITTTDIEPITAIKTSCPSLINLIILILKSHLHKYNALADNHRSARLMS